MNINLKENKIWLTSEKGMVGSALARFLKKKKIKYISTNRRNLNLLDQKKVLQWFKKNKPKLIFMTAAKVGGIYANNTYPAQFIYENLQIQNNIIEASKKFKVKKLIFLGSSCIYPRNCKQPIKEKDLLSGKLEKTNQWYAIAKIAGIKMVEAYRKEYNCNFVSVMPCNMYGPNDNYDNKNSHVLASLIKKFSYAKKFNRKKVEVWGTGKPLREFMYVDDFTEAILIVMNKYNSSEPINVGSGEEISIGNLAKLIAKITKFRGKIIYNKKFPDGVPRKILNSSKIKKLGWKPKTKLYQGIKKTIYNLCK